MFYDITEPDRFNSERKGDFCNMKTYICELCGYVYNPSEGDPENGIAPNTDFEDLPDDWVCPLCGASKEDFSTEETEEEEA